MPESPRTSPLGRHADVRVSNVDKKTVAAEQPVRLCNYMDAYTSAYLDGKRDYMVASATRPEITRFGLKPGDVVITKDSETPDDIGIAAVVDDVNGPLPLVCGYHLAILRSESINPVFLAKQLAHARLKAYFGKMATGSTRYGLSNRAITNTPLFLLPRGEQDRIEVILRTLDAAIRKTEEVIAKLQQMKQGLLHDLLTRGIDENGELRDPVRHPGQFKESALGRIPRAWDVRPIGSLLGNVSPAMRSGPFGSALLKSELADSGVPLLGIDNVHVERFVGIYTRFVPASKAAALSRYRVRPRDVMITIMGTVGRCCVVPDDVGHALSSKHVWTVTFDNAAYSPYLACAQLNHAPWCLRHLGRDQQGGIMAAIRSETLRTMPLPLPPRAEQEQMEETLVAADRRICDEQEYCAKSKLLKHGLMHDLLTGRVRVRVEGEGAA